ncbi:BBE domain-containing protein [Marivirga sp.]
MLKTHYFGKSNYKSLKKIKFRYDQDHIISTFSNPFDYFNIYFCKFH